MRRGRVVKQVWVWLVGCAAIRINTMLKLILETGYIDPELLEQIDEEQREMLFHKVREEQIRKWNIREKEILSLPVKPLRNPKVNFLEGSDGRPWVWVMGEHTDDLSYEEMVRKREAEKEEDERRKVREEAEELAKHETRDILLAAPTGNESTDSSGAMVRSESFMDYIETESPEVKRRTKVAGLWQKAIENRASLVQSMTEDERLAYEKRRADELYDNMLKGQEVAKQRAADVVIEIMKQWKQSEERAKAIERQHRQSIMIAKEKVKKEGVDDIILAGISEEKKTELTRKLSERSLRRKISHQVGSVAAKSTGKLKVMWKYASFVAKDTKPKTIDHAVKWFQENEVPKGVGKEGDGSISLWFHGGITRANAESLLINKPAGMYLVRLSNKVWGYTISVKTLSTVKHYIVDVSTPQVYKFIGKHQPEFPSLKNLLVYYRVNPITWKGQEVLLLTCEQPIDQLKGTQSIFEENEEETTIF